jgi:hypothetical protein
MRRYDQHGRALAPYTTYTHTLSIQCVHMPWMQTAVVCPTYGFACSWYVRVKK